MQALRIRKLDIMTFFTDLLRMDDVAHPYGCGLHPKLRVALEADLLWPSKAAATVPTHPVAPCQLPENVIQLSGRSASVGKKRA